MRRPWTDDQIKRARKMLADGMSRYEIDRYFGRSRNSTWQAITIRDNASYRARQLSLQRGWRFERSGDRRSQSARETGARFYVLAHNREPNADALAALREEVSVSKE